ncbi:MAG TPA: GxGYxYP domain-containing protein [Opitutaceae bacterium]|nr:GxGYxYP domain-containing protein [Opitutaceae bacterium]
MSPTTCRYLPRCIRWLLLAATLITAARAADNAPDLNGRWTILPEKSSAIELYDTLALDISRHGDDVTIQQTWGGDRGLHVTYALKTGGVDNLVPVTDRVWPTNVFMGVSMDTHVPEHINARWSADGRQLTLDCRYTVLASQGARELRSQETYTLSPYGDELTLTIARPVREGAPYTYVFKRAGTKEAWVMTLGNHWNVAGHLDENALLISLQGLANTTAPRLYFLYPDHWDFRFTPGVYDFYRQHLDYTFTTLTTVEQALKTFLPYVKGYIVWDKSARLSLDVAFTVAGLERGIVVSADQIPLAQKLGLKPLADLRGKYNGKSDLEVFREAYAEYGARCSRDYIVWMGGESGPRMLPGIADFGIMKGAFFTDLSTDPKDTAEYALAKEILGKQKPLSMLMGWHSYAKDRERNYVSLASSFGIRIEGLNTFPNLSFTSMTPPSPGFVWRNHHHVVPGKVYHPKKKVYVACLQTDGLGLGAWSRPGRGTMPYAWEVTINWLWMAPTMLEYYYTTATPNDYFIGAITGPGYMYPKAIPPKLLPQVIGLADQMIRKLDINVFETMDYSQGATVSGNTEIPKYIVDAYYKNMPEVIGFANGYAPAFTFASHDGRPFISFDYYLPEKRPEAEVVRDLQELARINPVRPYFLLVHVREWSDITRVKSIMDKLGPDFEVVPLDVFMKLAGQDPTFQERYQPEPAAP